MPERGFGGGGRGSFVNLTFWSDGFEILGLGRSMVGLLFGLGDVEKKKVKKKEQLPVAATIEDDKQNNDGDGGEKHKPTPSAKP